MAPSRRRAHVLSLHTTEQKRTMALSPRPRRHHAAGTEHVCVGKAPSRRQAGSSCANLRVGFTCLNQLLIASFCLRTARLLLRLFCSASLCDSAYCSCSWRVPHSAIAFSICSVSARIRQEEHAATIVSRVSSGFILRRPSISFCMSRICSSA